MKNEIKLPAFAKIPKGAKVLRSEILELDDTTLLIYELDIEKRFNNGDYVLINDTQIGIVKKHGYFITVFHIVLTGEKRELEVTLMNKLIDLKSCSKSQILEANTIMKKHGYKFNGKIERIC